MMEGLAVGGGDTEEEGEGETGELVVKKRSAIYGYYHYVSRE